MFRKLVDKILGEDSRNNTVAGWIAGFTVIVLIRSFLEVFSTTPYTGFVVSDSQRVHYFLFFLATALIITFVISVSTKQRGNRVVNLALYGLPIIFLAPILDIIIGFWGNFYRMGYLFDTHAQLFFDFIAFFGPLYPYGITLGIRIEVFIILCALGWYVWMKKKSVAVMLSSVVISYALIFILLALPGVLYTISHPSQKNVSQASVSSFMETSITKSNIPANILHGSLLYDSKQRLLMLGFSTMMSQLFFIISFIAGMLWSWYSYKNILITVLRNSRIERVLFYLSLLALGMLFSHEMSSIVFVWTDYLGTIVLFLSWFSAWMFAVHTNDIADIEIDAISNQLRPLPQKTLSVETMRDVGFMWLILSLVGSYIVGYYVFFMNIVFTSAYYLYSAPPLRLKRIPILSSFLISIACLATILAGFFFLSPNKLITLIPTLFVFGIIVMFTLGVNIRDIKDIEGDRATGIQTLPVFFGRYGKQVSGILLVLSLLLMPIFFISYFLYLTVIPTAIIGYWLCVREPYKEKYIFFLFFIFVLTSIIFHFLVS